MNAPNAAGVPSESDRVGGTVPPTPPSTGTSTVVRKLAAPGVGSVKAPLAVRKSVQLLSASAPSGERAWLRPGERDC